MIRLIIILIIAAALWLLWPRIRRWMAMWVVRRLQRNAEDYVRRASGMPPREEKKGERASRHRPRRSYAGGPLIPKEYAVDVEYVEIHEYSATTVIGGDAPKEKVEEWHESQVTDAEWVEIRDSGKR